MGLRHRRMRQQCDRVRRRCPTEDVKCEANLTSVSGIPATAGRCAANSAQRRAATEAAGRYREGAGFSRRRHEGPDRGVYFIVGTRDP